MNYRGNSYNATTGCVSCPAFLPRSPTMNRSAANHLASEHDKRAYQRPEDRQQDENRHGQPPRAEAGDDEEE